MKLEDPKSETSQNQLSSGALSPKLPKPLTKQCAPAEVQNPRQDGSKNNNEDFPLKEEFVHL